MKLLSFFWLTYYCSLGLGSLRCSWSIYIFILDLTSDFNELGKDNCRMRWETFIFWDLVPLISEVWCYLWRQLSTHSWSWQAHDDVIKWKHFPCYLPFVRGNHRSPVNSPHKGQWCGALMFSLICTWINSWANTRDAGDLRCHHAHYDIIVMKEQITMKKYTTNNILIIDAIWIGQGVYIF